MVVNLLDFPGIGFFIQVIDRFGTVICINESGYAGKDEVAARDKAFLACVFCGIANYSIRRMDVMMVEAA